MAYSARAIANFFLDLAEANGEGLSPMKLQKLIYFAHGWHLAIYGEPLIDEQVQAWDYGPVIATIYHDFKKFGNAGINVRAADFNGLKVVYPAVPESDTRTIALLKRIWEVYGGFSAVRLANMTHTPGSPWETARQDAGNKGLRSIAMDNATIGEYFASQARTH